MTGRLGLALAAALTLALVVGVALASAVPPTVTIEDATAVTYDTAHVAGTIDPHGQSTTYRIDVQPDGRWQENVANNADPWTSAVTAKEEIVTGAEQPVEADLTNLVPGTTYHLRIFAQNSETLDQAIASTFTTTAIDPAAATIDTPTGIDGTSVHLSGAINPEAPAGDPSVSDVNWQFEVSPDGGITWSPVGSGFIPADASSHPVETDATGLARGTTYLVRLAATNAAGTTRTATRTFTEPALAPTVAVGGVNVKQHEGTVRATVNPGGLETTYFVEYGTGSGYGQKSTVRTLPAGEAAVQVTTPLLNLTAGSTYHYRFVAQNSVGIGDSGDLTFTTASTAASAESCPNAAIRQEQGSTWLPECRAFELVNPPGLDLGDVTRSPDTSDDGNRVAWMSPVLPEGALGGAVAYTAASFRGPSGWSSLDGNVIKGDGEGSEITSLPYAFSQDFTKELRETLVAAEPGDTILNTADLYRINVGEGRGIDISKGLTFHNLMGADEDLSRVVYTGETAGEREIYLWKEGSSYETISLLPDGSKSPSAVSAARNSDVKLMRPGTESAVTFAPHGGVHAVSTDGTMVFFLAAGSPTYAANGGLFRRDTVTHTTAAISVSHRPGEEGVVKAATFIGAAPDGSSAFFFTEEPLVPGASNGGLYEYDFHGDSLTLIADIAPTEVAGAAPSGDGTHLYFTSPAVLASGAQSGATNAYEWDGESVRTVAAIEGSGEFQRVSLDGRFAVLESTAEIDGSTNDGHVALFEYDAATGRLACASCRPDGSPSTGEASLTAVPFASLGKTVSRNLTVDGKLFFTSTDRIVPADRTTARDVYEYDAGTVSLLTEGRGVDDSFLADNSDDGTNVFILTRSALLPQDQDVQELDMYDVRVDGGFPSPQSPPVVECRGEGCQPAAAAPPSFTGPSTRQVAGAGNVKKAAKHHKKKHHKKPHKKKKRRGHHHHAKTQQTGKGQGRNAK